MTLDIRATGVERAEVRDGGMFVYKIIYSAVDRKPGVRGNSLKRMVGARGFEPPTPWSRTGESENLKPCGCRIYKHWQPQNPASVGPQSAVGGSGHLQRSETDIPYLGF